jgi:hypothetical protein
MPEGWGIPEIMGPQGRRSPWAKLLGIPWPEGVAWCEACSMKACSVDGWYAWRRYDCFTKCWIISHNAPHGSSCVVVRGVVGNYTLERTLLVLLKYQVRALLSVGIQSSFQLWFVSSLKESSLVDCTLPCQIPCPVSSHTHSYPLATRGLVGR